MVVGSSVFDVLKWGGLLVAAGGAIALKVVPRGWQFWAALGVCAVGLGAAFGLRHVGTEVVIVRDDGGRIDTTREVMYFGDGYQFHDGHIVDLAPTDGTLIVNDTDRTLSLISVTYGSPLPGSNDAIPPQSKYASKLDVDYLGPDHEPPQTINSDVSIEIKTWLTW